MSELQSSELSIDERLAENVQYLLRQYIVYRIGSEDFGLGTHRSKVSNEEVVTGWLLQKRHQNLMGVSWKKRYCVVATDAQGLKLCKDESLVVEYYLGIEDIVSIQVCYSTTHQHYHLLIRTLSKRSDDQVIDLRPIEEFNYELAVRWCAFLTYKWGLYDCQLEREQDAATLVAIGMQSVWRGRHVRMHLKDYISANSSEHSGWSIAKRAAYSSHLAKFVTRLYSDRVTRSVSYNNESSRNTEKAGQASQPRRNPPVRGLSNLSIPDLQLDGLPSRAKSVAVMEHKTGTTPKAEMENVTASVLHKRHNSADAAREDHKPHTHKSVQIPLLPFHLPTKSDPTVGMYKDKAPTKTNATRLPPLQPGEVEDEIWENQRWQAIAVRGTVVQRGWGGGITLLPTDRADFTDRLGRGSFPAPTSGRVPLPPGWKITTPFTVDTSGVVDAKCSSQGWSYQTAFPQLDGDFARGSTKSQASPLWLVRRRRWYRRRVPLDLPKPLQQQVLAAAKGVVFQGWLGIRASNTHRWKSRWCVLVEAVPRDSENQRKAGRDGLLVPGLGRHAHWSYFKYAFRERGADGEMALGWEEVGSKHLKSRVLCSSSAVSDSVACATSPGLFTLQQAPQEKPRLLNAFSGANKDAWMQALQRVIKSSYDLSVDDLRRVQKTNSAFSFRGTGMEVMRKLNRALRLPADVVFPSPRESQRRSSSLMNSLGSSRVLQGFASGSSRDGMSSQVQDSDEGMMCTNMERLDSNESDVNDVDMDSCDEYDNQARGDWLMDGTPATSGDEDGDPLLDDDEGDLNQQENSAPKKPAPSSEPWTKPTPLGYEMSNLVLGVPVDKLHHVLYEDDRFEKALWKAQNLSEIVSGGWTRGVAPGSTRDINYMMPKKGLVPANRAYIKMEYLQACPGKGYEIDVTTTNPDVPYGSTFVTKLKYILVSLSDEKSRITVSHATQFISSTIMKKWIESGSRNEIIKHSRETYDGLVQKFTQGSGERLATTRKVIERRRIPDTSNDQQKNEMSVQQPFQNVAHNLKQSYEFPLNVIAMCSMLVVFALLLIGYELREIRFLMTKAQKERDVSLNFSDTT